VIEYLRRSLHDRVGLAYHYFDCGDPNQQAPTTVIPSLLKQLLIQTEDIAKSVPPLESRYQRGEGLPGLSELEEAYLHVSGQFLRTYLVIDAFDECESHQHRQLFLAFLNKLDGKTNRIFVTTRSYRSAIERSFRSVSLLSIEASDSDIKRYVSKKLQENSDMSALIDPPLEEMIVTRISNTAKGMLVLLSPPSGPEFESLPLLGFCSQQHKLRTCCSKRPEPKYQERLNHNLKD
jgi:hypothetical protein